MNRIAYFSDCFMAFFLCQTRIYKEYFTEAQQILKLLQFQHSTSTFLLRSKMPRELLKVKFFSTMIHLLSFLAHICSFFEIQSIFFAFKKTKKQKQTKNSKLIPHCTDYFLTFKTLFTHNKVGKC